MLLPCNKLKGISVMILQAAFQMQCCNSIENMNMSLAFWETAANFAISLERLFSLLIVFIGKILFLPDYHT